MTQTDDEELSHVHPRVLFIDHTGIPGGGQLGLLRFLSMNDSLDAATLFYAGGPVVESLRSRGESVMILGSSSKKWAYFFSAFALHRTLKRATMDAVVVNSVKAASLVALLPKKRGVTYIYYLRDDVNRKRLSRQRWQYLSKTVLPRFDAYLANSEWTASTIPQNVAARPVRVAYPVSGSNDSKLPLARTSTADRTLRVLSLSRIARWKGIHVLVDALCILESRGYADRVQTHIVGGSQFEDAEYGPELERKAKALLTPITFVGHVDDVSPYLANSDVLVSCSITPEPFGQVIIQGMSQGLVVIATNQGGPAEIIKNDRSGLLVKADDSHALADALQQLIDNPSLVERISTEAPSGAARFADEITSKELERAIIELIAAVKANREGGK